MREEDYADVPDEVMAEYFAARDRRRSAGSCFSCVYYGCCNFYCGGKYWKPEESDDKD